MKHAILKENPYIAGALTRVSDLLTEKTTDLPEIRSEEELRSLPLDQKSGLIRSFLGAAPLLFAFGTLVFLQLVFWKIRHPIAFKSLMLAHLAAASKDEG